MKKTILILFLLLVMFSLCACGDIYLQMPEGSTVTLPDGTTAVSGSVSASSAETLKVTVTPEPIAAASPSPTPVAASDVSTVPSVSGTAAVAISASQASTAASANVYVTKSPYSESVPVGGSCVFIAYAANSTNITWTLVNWDASVTYNLSDGPYYFPGLCVYGQGTSTITLTNVPSSLNGWRVQVRFDGNGGPVYSDLAYIWTYVPSRSSCPAPRNDCDHHECHESCVKLSDPCWWDCQDVDCLCGPGLCTCGHCCS